MKKSPLDRARDHEADVMARFMDGRATFQEAARAQSAREALEHEADNAPPPLTRASIKAMSVAEFDDRADEIARWAAAGGPDGEPAPAADAGARGVDHVWTRAEIQAMTPADFDANEAAIDAAAKAGKIAP